MDDMKSLCERLRYFASAIQSVTYRHDEQQAEPYDNNWRYSMTAAADVIEGLFPEVERLRADNTVLERNLKQAHMTMPELCAELLEIQRQLAAPSPEKSELERFREDNKRLRALLHRWLVAEIIVDPGEHHDYSYGDLEALEDETRFALGMDEAAEAVKETTDE
jgi:hypothetical protein